jgi:hypothetical protein
MQSERETTRECVTHHHACDCREAAHAAEVARLRATIDLIRQDAWTHPLDYETDRRMRLERIADRIRALSETANEF